MNRPLSILANTARLHAFEPLCAKAVIHKVINTLTTVYLRDTAGSRKLSQVTNVSTSIQLKTSPLPKGSQNVTKILLHSLCLFPLPAPAHVLSFECLLQKKEMNSQGEGCFMTTEARAKFLFEKGLLYYFLKFLDTAL